jgi:hypothetical protein
VEIVLDDAGDLEAALEGEDKYRFYVYTWDNDYPYNTDAMPFN